MEDVKQPSEAGMMCTIDGDTFYLSTKNTWIRDSGALCHITNDATGMFYISYIDDSIQETSSIMPATKKGKLWINVWQVEESSSIMPATKKGKLYINVWQIDGIK